MGDHELIKKKTENYQKKLFSWSSVAIGNYFSTKELTISLMENFLQLSNLFSFLVEGHGLEPDP
jgi:hypothetical protein